MIHSTTTMLLGFAAVLTPFQTTAASPTEAPLAGEHRAYETFRNPVLSGHWHDPTVLRDGDDYYMTHCEHDQRGPIIWHSRDLVNWRPLTRIESLAGVGNIWATDLVRHGDTYFLYLPLMLPSENGRLRFTNCVVTAPSITGPWSAPIDLGFGGIDPGHVVDRDGSRYIYVNEGRVIPLAPDGLSTVGDLVPAYDGWSIPPEWVIECVCLESPKLFWRGDWCYMVSALGGTAGPSTSHMIVVARARSALGPWENAPDSPFLRTSHRSEPWWSQGHGTFVEATDGSWWVVYHAIRNGHRSLGRNTLLLPVEWSEDGWPRIPPGVTADAVLRKPPGENVGHGMPLSDDFDDETLAIQWDFAEATPDASTRFVPGNKRLRVTAAGDSFRTSSRLLALPSGMSFEVEVAIEVPAGAEGGLVLSSGEAMTGLGVKDGRVFHHRRGMPEATTDYSGRTVWLKLRNEDHDVVFFHSADGATWEKFHWGASVSSESVQRIVLYALGEGEVVFKHFRHRDLQERLPNT